METKAGHVLVFPSPAQGHINCMLDFGIGLLNAGVHVTFLHTEHNLRRLGQASTAASPRLRFLSVPDGLPDEHPRSVDDVMEIAKSLRAAAAGPYGAILIRRPSQPADEDGGANDDDAAFPPVTCVVADGLLPWAMDIAEELGIPALAFRTSSACSFLCYLSVPKMLELGELPFPAGGDLDEPVHGVPGMEAFLRRRDLPSFFRLREGTHDVDPILQVICNGTTQNSKSRALVLNTASSLELSALRHIRSCMSDVFAIGPLHTMSPAPPAASSLWREDDGCLAWLNGQRDRSVVYVSMGSLAVVSQDQFTELLSGLVGTGYPFIWVLRPDMLDAQLNKLLQEAVSSVGGAKRCLLVPWVPQKDVLRHRAVGCFVTHAGWNSTLEGVTEGVPMVCCPFFADQQINSRFIGAVWRTGLDMKDVWDRAIVESMVREAMESIEVRASAKALAERISQDVSDGGSSATEFRRLVKYIRDLVVPQT